MDGDGGGHSRLSPPPRQHDHGDSCDTVEYSQSQGGDCVDTPKDIKSSGKWRDSEIQDLDSDVGKDEIPRMSIGPSRAANFKSRVQTTRDVIFQSTELWVEEYIWCGLLRQQKLPKTKDGRHIDLDASTHLSLIDERTGHHYPNNTIRSSRYTIWTFLPLQFWFQFTKAQNVFFLIMAALQLVPGLSTTGSFTTALPLIIFFVFSIAREGYDDFRRYKLDKTENRRLARVLYGYRPGGVNGQSSQTLVSTAHRRWKSFLNALQRSLPGGGVEIILVTTGAKDLSLSTPSASTATPLAGSIKSEPDLWSSSGSDPDPWATVKWIDLKVGDIIELKRNEQVPADMVLLHADGRNGVAYIETMALDGETNLKTRQPPTPLAERCNSLAGLASCRAAFAVENPNPDLYEFNGNVTVGKETLPLTLNNIIYRGCTLRNTNRAVGMIVNTGEECKIRKNASKHPKTKAPVMQKTANRVIIILSVFVVLLSVGCSMGYIVWTRVYEKKAQYLAGGHVPFEDIIIAFLIMFNNLIPLALYVSLEIVKLCQYLLLRDIEMYDEASNTPMVSNTQTMFENLGQINYIFSDKTGTLTENVMRFRKISVAGTAWSHDLEKPPITSGEANCGTAQKAVEPKVQIAAAQLPSEKAVIASNTPSTATGSRLVPPTSIAPSSDMPTAEPELGTRELMIYLQKNPDTDFSRRTRLFLLSLALCHSCFPEVQRNGEIGFQAASPDELALVEAARELGYILFDRVTNSITLNTYPNGPEIAVEEVYQVLDIIEFSSKRKRMSIVVRFPDGRLCILCKGADSVIESKLRHSSLALAAASEVKYQHELRASEEAERASARRSLDLLSKRTINRFGISLQVPSLGGRSASLDRASFELDLVRTRSSRKSRDLCGDRDRRIRDLIREAETLDERHLFKRCFQHIDGFASEGLRTLVYAYRFLDDEEYQNWAKSYHEASTSLVNRQEMIERAGEMIEKDFDLAGATAIEDKLQSGVPETIDKLQRANIKIWMLTGDKRETAINIAHSAHLCKTYSQTIIINHDQGDIREHIEAALIQVNTGRHTVIVIDGQTLNSVEHDEALSNVFYNLLIRADSVICCRASPAQKAAMVKAIRHKVSNSVTLAIGDGGNDISMIQEAHVGVGISGKEGLQAARVADFSIAQFRFLQRLLLVHGHWNYIRTAKNVLWTFWKEMLFYSIQIMYCRWAGYTGTSLYESDSLTVWNALFTSLCVMIPGIFEQDLSAATLLAVPELYAYGQQSKGFNLKKYVWWMVLAGVQSQFIWWGIYGIYGLAPFTEDQGLFAIGDLAFSVCVVYINIKLL